jgi:IS30 family transposase
MICRWEVKNPLTLEERRRIKEGIDLDMSYQEIADYVGRSKSTVRRECIRLGSYQNYHPEKAQADFENKQRIKRKNFHRE